MTTPNEDDPRTLQVGEALHHRVTHEAASVERVGNCSVMVRMPNGRSYPVALDRVFTLFERR